MKELTVDTMIKFNNSEYNKMLGINKLTGIITKIIHKNTGVTYNIECESNGDSLCCVPHACVDKI